MRVGRSAGLENVWSDVGGYTYGAAANGAGPHAVSSINTSATSGCMLTRCLVDGISNPFFYYDGDGNMLCVTTKSSCDSTAARNYGYTSFDMVGSIAAGATTNSIGYSPEHQRASLLSGGVTMYYLSNPAGADMEELTAGTTPTWRTYVGAYGHIVAQFFTSGTTTTPYYFVGDHLMSTTALADANGNLLGYYSYDAWGLDRNKSGTDYSTGCTAIHPSPATRRRYTGQEAMDPFCLINLNARIYDPALGRMLSADPMVGYPNDGQSFDRYAYALNNPLAFEDPSGFMACHSENINKNQTRWVCQDDGDEYSGDDETDDPWNPGFGGAGYYPCIACNNGSYVGDSSTPVYGGEWLGFMNGGMAGFAGGGSYGVFGDFGGGSEGFDFSGSPTGFSPGSVTGNWVTTEVGTSEYDSETGEWSPYSWDTGAQWLGGLLDVQFEPGVDEDLKNSLENWFGWEPSKADIYAAYVRQSVVNAAYLQLKQQGYFSYQPSPSVGAPGSGATYVFPGDFNLTFTDRNDDGMMDLATFVDSNNQSWINYGQTGYWESSWAPANSAPHFPPPPE